MGMFEEELGKGCGELACELEAARAFEEAVSESIRSSAFMASGEDVLVEAV